MNTQLLRAPLIAALTLFAVLFVAPAAHATYPSVPPVKVDGNPKCEDFGLTAITKFDPVNSGVRDGITLTKHDIYYVKWTSTVPVDWVIVKGGPNANIYKYATDKFGDDWLSAPTNPETWKPYGLSHVEFCTDGNTETEPKPGIAIAKTGAQFAYAGDTVTYTFTVTNTGGVTLSNVSVVDPLCTGGVVTKVTQDSTFNKGDVWTYTCTRVVPAGMDIVSNTATACGKYGDTQVCDEDDHSFPVRTIAIRVDKAAVQQTAVAGSTVNFTMAVTNTGNTSFVNYVFEDANCDEQRTGANAGDTTLDPGETWTYACAMATQVGQTSADNTAKATGTNSDGKSATDDGSASIPLTQPVTPPGGSTPGGGTPPAGSAPALPGAAVTPPAGAVLPETISSGRAQLRGPSGCVYRAFRARVTGRGIASVRFYVDGKLVKKITGKRANYSVKVVPRRLGFGRHRVVARVKFNKATRTRARVLPLTFSRCARQVVRPRFTG
jgi:uncharacterized repeat protein (TIGR01451 family)